MILTMMEENFYVLNVAIKWNIGILVISIPKPAKW